MGPGIHQRNLPLCPACDPENLSERYAEALVGGSPCASRSECAGGPYYYYYYYYYHYYYYY